MGNSTYTPWQQTIRWLTRRVPPTHKRAFPTMFATIIAIMTYLIFPIFLQAILMQPMLVKLLTRGHLIPVLYGIYYLSIALLTFTQICLWACVISLSWPSYFNAHDERHM